MHQRFVEKFNKKYFIYQSKKPFSFFLLFFILEIIKDTARPDYWVPDAEALRCHICKMQFGTAEELVLSHGKNDAPQSPQKAFKGGDCKRHHCRKCGQGVCADCSKTRRPVPDRGWPDDVRICDVCVNDNTAVAASASNPTTYHQTNDDPKTKVE